ncbi:MAG: flagellar hook-length control protein FliK [Nitrospirae bacterium]|nr:flagellar hook-length control protein FliK [Nitrospirota bacterium]
MKEKGTENTLQPSKSEDKSENKPEVKEEKPSGVFQDSPNDPRNSQNLPILLKLISENTPEQMNQDQDSIPGKGANKDLLTAETNLSQVQSLPPDQKEALKEATNDPAQTEQPKGDSAEHTFIHSDPLPNGPNSILTKENIEPADQKERAHSERKIGVETKTDLPEVSNSFNPSINLSQKVDEGTSNLNIQGSKGDFLEVFNHLPQEDQKVLRQVANSFVLQHTSKEEKISLKLEPESLGSLQIDIHLHNKEVKADMIASHPVVRDLLEKHQDLLRNTLSEYGLKFEKLSVTVSDSSSQYKQNDYPSSHLGKGDGLDSPVRPAQAISQGLPGIQTNHRMDHQISLYV